VNEFELIRTYFQSHPVARDDVVVGIGDDAAVVTPPPDTHTVITTDVLVAGVHFLSDADPVSIGHKSLAVNLSDLAAMGAEPTWFTLDLTLPDVNTDWLQEFSQGLFGLARLHNVQLIGGDVSRGPLAIAITAYGLVPTGQMLLRSGAQVGDAIYVTGELGDAGLALKHQLSLLQLSDEDIIVVSDRFSRPMPRLQEGMALRGIATSAIDISDGLVADLGHILEASGVGAQIYLGRLPLSAVYRAHLDEVGWDLALANGEDYELCFTVSEQNRAALDSAKANFPNGLVMIGRIESEAGLRMEDASGKPYRTKAKGHDHFAD